jgi:DeoR/GlpR family transcriptional regulator of sugar metabolism
VLVVERRRALLEFIRRREVAGVRDLAKLVGTSDVTIRRDLALLASQGLVERTHGAAILADSSTAKCPYHETATTAEDSPLARCAYALVRAGDAIGIGSGVTMIELAKALRAKSSLTVATNSLLVCEALAEIPQIGVFVTAGSLSRTSMVLVGPSVDESLGSIALAFSFVSGTGLSAKRGLSTSDPFVALADRALCAAAAKVVVLIDGTRIGSEGTWLSVPCRSIQIVITSRTEHDGELQRIRDAGVEIVVAT